GRWVPRPEQTKYHVLKALARMMNWVRVTQHIAETEFPEHDLLSALNVFYVSSVDRLEARRLSAADCAALSKVARGFDINEANLVAQVEDHLPIVDHKMRLDSSLTCTAAWAKALAT
ncbi:MAG: hypothetical protein ACKPKO_07350, partial [Candidatus Fonsibacter sp.]